EPKREFSGESRFQRVDRARSVVVSRCWPRALVAAASFSVGAGVLCAAGRIVIALCPDMSITGFPALLAPFNLRGPAFLAALAAAFALLAALAAGIRRLCRGPAADVPALRLTTYETAHLAGGEDAVLCAALASLVSRGALTISPRGRLERGPAAGDA